MSAATSGGGSGSATIAAASLARRRRPAFLPGGDDRSRRDVVGKCGARGRECNSTAGALATALDRPSGRRAAAGAERRPQTHESPRALDANLRSSGAAEDAAPRQEHVQHRLGRYDETCAGIAPLARRDSVERVLVALRQTGARTQTVISVEELRAIPDVAPVSAERIRVDTLMFVEPDEERPRWIRRVAFVEVATNERHVLAMDDVRRYRNERRRRVVRLFDEVDHAVVVIDGDNAVLARELTRADVVHRERACGSLVAPEVDVLNEAELEQVVACDHENVVVERRACEHEVDVADRAEAVVLARRAVVVDRDRDGAPGGLGPSDERSSELRIRDDVDCVDLVDLFDAVEDPVEHRPPADGQERLRDRLRQRVQTRRVARGEDERFHGEVASVVVGFPSPRSGSGAWTVPNPHPPTGRETVLPEDAPIMRVFGPKP